VTDPLIEHYAEVIRYIETVITRRIPRLPFVNPPLALTDDEVATVAEGLALAHQVAATEVAQ